MYESNERRDVDEREVERTRSGVSPALIALIVVAIVAIVFVVQNGEKRQVNILFWDVTTWVWLVIAASMVIGALLAKLVGILWRHRRRAS